MNDSTQATPSAAAPPPRRRWRRRLGLGLLSLLLVLAALLYWLLASTSGLRFALDQASRLSHGALQVKQAEGRLAGPLTLSGIRYADGAGTEVQADTLALDLKLWPLLRRRLHVLNLQLGDTRVTLPPSRPDQPASSGNISLKPPLALVLDRVRLGRLDIRQGGQLLFASNSLTLAGQWTDQGIALRQLALRAPQGRVDLDGRLAIGRDYRGDGRASFAWTLSQLGYAGTLQVRSDGAKAHAVIALTAPTPLELTVDLEQRGDFAWQARLDAPPFDPKPLLGDSALNSLGLALQGQGDRYGGTLHGQLKLNDYQLDLQPLEAAFDHDYHQLRLKQLLVGSPQVAGQLRASGTIQLDAKPLSAALTVDWRRLQLPPALVGQTLASEGQLQLQGSAEHYQAQGQLKIGPPGKLADLQLKLAGTPQQIELDTLTLKQPQGDLSTSGVLTLAPQLGWQLTARAHRFDPGQLLAGWDGALDLDLQSHGSLPKDQPDVYLSLDTLAGRLRRRQLKGSGQLHLSPDQVVDGRLQLASGASTLRLEARPGPRNDATLTLAIQSLGDWLPDAGGRLDGQFALTGMAPHLAIRGQLKGQKLSYQTQRATHLQLDADVPDISQPGGTLKLAAQGVMVGGLEFTRINLDGSGDAAAHQLRLSAQGQPLSAELALSGSMKNQRWRGSLGTLNLDLAGLPRWRLQHATALSYADGAVELSELCLTAGEPLLCAAAKQDKAGNLTASYRLHQLPLALLTAATAQGNLPLQAQGMLEGRGTIQRNAAGALSGQASITSAQGSITYTQHPDRPLLSYRQLALDAELSPSSQRATLRAQLDDSGRLDGQISISGAQQALAGRLDVDLNSLGFVELFTDALANLKGTAKGQFRFGGSLASPQLTGQLALDGLAAEVPAAGLKLDQGHILASAVDPEHLKLQGSVRSGKGQLTLDGQATLAPALQAQLKVQGKNFTATDIPAAKVVVSPQLELQQNAQGLNVTGQLVLDSADVNLEKLPGAGAVQASPDVVIVGPQASLDAQEQAAQAMPIRANVKVDLGRRTHVVGMGLDGHLYGNLTVIEVPGQATLGQGQIGVDGTYKAYGQNLSIEQGQLLFASTPIDNPGLNIRAVRKLNPNATIDEGQKVGLYIAGTAQRPQLTVFSDPVMDQSDALSYLVTGKPLSQVKGGEGDMVGAAAQALGSAAGNLLAKSIGSRLGVDDVGVSSSDALGGNSAFTVGKYLSPRLYLSYGVGLFEAGQVITLRYRLSHHWSFEAQNATDFSRASLNYRIEK